MKDCCCKCGSDCSEEAMVEYHRPFNFVFVMCPSCYEATERHELRLREAS